MKMIRHGRQSVPLSRIGPSLDRHQSRSRAWKRRSCGRGAISVTCRNCFGQFKVSRSRAPAIRDITHAARKLRLPGRLARRWNCEGLDLIAAGLRRDAVAVF
jgi:hypothetical protein